MGLRAWSILAGAIVVGLAAPVEARRMASGVTIDDRFLLPNDPATKAGTLVSPALLSQYGDHRTEMHCFMLQDNGTIGRVTLYGIWTVSLGTFTTAVFNGAIDPAALRNVSGGNIEPVGRFLAQHFLRAANGDKGRARAALRAAELRDTRCMSDIARFYRATAELNRSDRGMLLAADGKWVVNMLKPGFGARLLQSSVRIVQDTLKQTEMLERGYRAAYADLGLPVAVAPAAPKPRPPAPVPARPDPKQVAPSPEAPRLPVPAQPDPPKEAAVTPAKPETGGIQDATAAMRSTLNTVRQYCLLQASVAQCG